MMNSIFKYMLSLGLDDYIRFKLGRDTVADRFIWLFEAHGVHRNQIPFFFGHNIHLSDIDSKPVLLEKLDKSLLNDACQMFGVRDTWLLNPEEKIYDVQNFNKCPEDYRQFLSALISSGDEPIMAYLYLSTSREDEDTLLILKQHIGYLNDESVCRLYICGGWKHKYWKSRAEIAACIAVTLNAGIYLHGYWVKSSISSMSDGERLPNYLKLLKLDKSKHRSKDYRNWHPDRWVFDPRIFVDGIGEGKFGKVSALARWLEYEEQGLMETGYSCGSAASLFRKYKNEI